MTEIVVGRLSTKGWAKTVPDKMRQALQNYESSAYSQSTVFAGKIVSWPYAQQRANDDPEVLVSLVQRDLDNLYRSIFSNGEVNVSVGWEWEDEKEVIFLLTIEIEVRVDGQSFDLNDVLRSEGA
tara:strand:- start:27418 stop:27792 length:375 start_codon:yes stop_codon:yes gene_type:complete